MSHLQLISICILIPLYLIMIGLAIYGFWIERKKAVKKDHNWNQVVAMINNTINSGESQIATVTCKDKDGKEIQMNLITQFSNKIEKRAGME